jgi:hypothetical protein
MPERYSPNALIIAKRMLLRLDIGVENETKDQVAFAKRHLEVAKNEQTDQKGGIKQDA